MSWVQLAQQRAAANAIYGAAAQAQAQGQQLPEEYAMYAQQLEQQLGGFEQQFGGAVSTQAADQMAEVGMATKMVVSGCADPVVGNYLRGTYTLHGENHGRPCYRRDTKVSGSDVLVYFWDERDGVADSGWWFAPEIGGSMVWAFHPNRASITVPCKGWKAPISAGVDPTVVIRALTQQESMMLEIQQRGIPQSMMEGMGMDGSYGMEAAYGMDAASQGNPATAGMSEQEYALRLQQQQEMIRQASASKRLGALGGVLNSGKGEHGGQQDSKMAQVDAVKRMMEQQRAAQGGGGLRKMKLCNNFEAGYCPRGDRCTFAHGEEDLGQPQPQRPPQQKGAKGFEKGGHSGLAEARKSTQVLNGMKEAKAMGKIMLICRKLKACQPEQLEVVVQELVDALAQDLENCGTAKVKVEAESRKILEEAKSRCANVLEKRKKEEEQKAELAKKRAEAEVKAGELLQQMDTHLLQVEEVVESLEALQGTSDDATTLSKIEKLKKAMELTQADAIAKLKVCKDFITANKKVMAILAAIKNNDEKTGTLAPTMKDCAQRLQQVDARVNKCKATEATVLAKMKAKTKYADVLAVFDKYDKDKDGHLSSKEAIAYAKGEFGFSLSVAHAEKICARFGGGKGVPREKHHLFKVHVGVVRETALSDELKAAREAKEKELEASKAALKEKIDAALKVVSESKSGIAEVEEILKTAPTLEKTLSTPEMVAKAAEFETQCKSLKDPVAAAQKELAVLKEGASGDLLQWLSTEVGKVATQLNAVDTRINRVASDSLMKFRKKAKEKDSADLQDFEQKAKLIFRRYHRKCGKDVVASFAELAGKDKEVMVAAEFVSFFRKQREEKADEDEDKLPGLADDEATRLLACIDDEGNGGFRKEAFCRMIECHMKVIKPLVITTDLDIKGESLRRLEAGEVLRVLQGPVKNQESDQPELERVKAVTVSDGLEGWVTLKGNKGTTYLEEVMGQYKVTKDTLLTETFVIAPSSRKDDLKLRVGDQVQVREWPKKEEKSGLVRMKVRVKTGAQASSVGWVTLKGNTGMTYLDSLD